MSSLPSFIANPDPNLYYGEGLTLDFETDTSHGDYGHPVHEDNGLLLASWKFRGTLRSHWGSEFEQTHLLDDIERADFIIAHNAKYELGWLKRCGMDLSKKLVFCTQLGEYVLLGNLASGDDFMVPRSTSLDACCRRRGWRIKDPVVDIMIKHGINPVEIPRPWLQGRCEQDVADTERLFYDQRDRLTRTGRLGVQYTRCLLTPVLADIEFEGMRLDEGRVEKTYREYVAKEGVLTAEMDDLTNGINWRSVDQVAHFLYEELGFEELRNYKGEPLRNAPSKQFPDGRPKTDKATLDSLKAKTKDQKRFVKLRKELGKVADALSKNLQFFQGVCKEMGGVFHAVFNQTRTATHRLSSSGIRTFFEMFQAEKTAQFQNMARIFKPLFRAKKDGWKIVEIDGSQLEFRVAAHLGRCGAARNLIISGGDVHGLSTQIQFSLDEAALRKLEESDPKGYKQKRTASKSWTFQPLYGGEGSTPKQKKYAAAFREAYPGISQAQKSWTLEVGSTGRLVTEWGMRYYWPRAKFGRDGELNVKTSVYNYPVQAFATAEIIPIAVVYFWHRVKSGDMHNMIKLVNTVHDSIIVEADPRVIDTVKYLGKLAFTHDVYRYLEAVYSVRFDFVPLGVGITVGDHWTEGKEESYNIYFDGTEERVA